jgi:hypothetical protein
LRIHYGVTVLALCLVLNARASAATLKGTAKNGTTRKPAAGDEVILLPLTGRTTEAVRSQTDAGGTFRFTVPGTEEARLVRVIHQGVIYQSMAGAGMNSVEVQVFDVASVLSGVTAIWDMQRLQAMGGKLQVIEEIAVHNASDPPRTLVNDRPFEIQLPAGAEVVAGKVQVADGQPVVRTPSPSGENGRFYFLSPLLPGETRFAIAYRLPYRGQAMIEPETLYPLAQLLVVLPETMKFEPKSPGVFQPMPGRPGANVYGTTARKQGQPLAFRVSGLGTLPQSAGGPQATQGDGTARAGNPPASSTRLPEPRHNDRWFFLGGSVVVLAGVAAGLRAHKRKQPGRVEA